MSLRYFVNDCVMVPVAPIIAGTILFLHPTCTVYFSFNVSVFYRLLYPPFPTKIPVCHSIPKRILLNRSFAKYSNCEIWKFLSFIDMVGKVQTCIAYQNVRKSSLVDCFIINVIRCQLSSTIFNCCQLSSTVVSYLQLLSTVVNCRQLSSTVVNCRQLSSAIFTCCQLSSTVVNCRQLSSPVVNCHQI